MLFYDSDILIENIRRLMDDNKVTQQMLADALQMSQSNVSKALSTEDKKSFTLDQVAGIAKFFRTSIDKLLGLASTHNPEISQRGVAAFIAALIENEKAEFIPYKREERVHIIDYNHINYENGYPEPRVIDEKKDVDYLGIMLPSYWYVPSDLTPYEEQELASEWCEIVNETAMCAVNTFLKDFKQIHNIHKNGGLTEETYRKVVNDLLSHLRD